MEYISQNGARAIQRSLFLNLKDGMEFPTTVAILRNRLTSSIDQVNTHCSFGGDVILLHH